MEKLKKLENMVSESDKTNLEESLGAVVEAVLANADGKNVDIPTKLFDELAPKYKDVNGGYTRIIRKGQRRGDAAETVILELI